MTMSTSAPSISQTASVQTYTTYQRGEFAYELYAQRYDSRGDAIGNPIRVDLAAYPDLDGSIAEAVVLKNGGFYLTYEALDHGSTAGGESTVLEQFDSDGNFSGATILNYNDWFTYSVYQSVALSNGGYAILSTTYSSPNSDENVQTLQLTFGGLSGDIVTRPITTFESDGGTPLPMYVQSPATLTIGADDTVILTYQRYYTPPNPDFPTDDPAGYQTYTEIFDDRGDLLSKRFVDFDKTTTTVTYDPVTGNELTSYTRHPDGAFDAENLRITGRDYTDQEASYDKDGHLISMVRHHADGSIEMVQSIGSDGSQSVADYDLEHRQTVAVEVAIDNSKVVTIYSYAGDAATATAIESDTYGTDGMRRSSDIAYADGSHRQIAQASGVVLTSTANAPDTLVGSALGGDRLIFGGTFGKDTVLGFREGAVTGHDIVELHAADIADFQDLQSHLSQTDIGTLITIDPHVTILLHGISLQQLSAEDFAF